jgi:hypothetical protein
MRLAALLLGCSDPALDPGGVPDALADWTAPGDTAEDGPVWTADEAATALVESASVAPGAAWDVRAAYLSRMAMGDRTCPGDPTQLMDTLVPYEGCDAASGVHYWGVSTFQDAVDDAPGTPSTTFVLTGDFRIRSPGGGMMLAGGVVKLRQRARDGGVERRAEVGGTWSAEGEASWMDPGASAMLEVVALDTSASHGIRVTGGWSTPTSAAVYYDALRFDSACGAHPTGVARVHDPAGGWWTMAFEDACTGCGTFSYGQVHADATDAGESRCIDLRGLASVAHAMVEAR